MSDPRAVGDPAEVGSCPCCGTTSGVTVIPGTSPDVRAWRCVECRAGWAVTAVNPHLRRRYLDELAEDVAALAVLREVIALRDQADTLTEGRLRARLIGCLARLDQICRWGADPHALAGHRPTNGVPGAQSVPRSTLTPLESGATGTAR